jgi:hypothetical protein
MNRATIQKLQQVIDSLPDSDKTELNNRILKYKIEIQNADSQVDTGYPFEHIVDNDGYRESKELPYIIIYCIDNYNGKGDHYVGITSNPFTRMINHKSEGKINTEEYIELDRADTRAEAEKLEAQYHARGYDGAKGWELEKTINN